MVKEIHCSQQIHSFFTMQAGSVMKRSAKGEEAEQASRPELAGGVAVSRAKELAGGVADSRAKELDV